MASIEKRKQIDILETLKSFKALESLRFSEHDVKKQTLRTKYYEFRREGLLGTASFSVISIPNSDDYVVTRTA